MNWNQVQGQWHQLAEYAVKSRWAILTDDDLANVAGKKQQFAGKLQEHYGIVNQDAERQIDELAREAEARSRRQVLVTARSS